MTSVDGDIKQSEKTAAGKNDPAFACINCNSPLAGTELDCPSCKFETMHGMELRLTKFETLMVFLMMIFMTLPLLMGPWGGLATLSAWIMLMTIPNIRRAKRRKLEKVWSEANGNTE